MSHDPSRPDDSNTPRDHHDNRGTPSEYEVIGREPTFLGLMNPDDETGTTAVLYDDRTSTVFQADVDEDEQRLVPREDTERELESTDRLGETLEEYGDQLEWNSLSEFARERLQNDEPTSEAAAETTSGLETVTFTQSNVAATADHDLEFSGSYRGRTDERRELTVERTFEVTLDDSDDPQVAVVDVIEQVLRTDDAAGASDGTDADHLEERETGFEIDLTATATDRELECVVQIEDQCQKWHESHVEPPR